jgi:hypothetical protein
VLTEPCSLPAAASACILVRSTCEPDETRSIINLRALPAAYTTHHILHAAHHGGSP